MILIPHYSQHPYYWNPALHLLYVGDERRVGAFRNALREVVHPGMVVADIGSGTGVLARFATEAGAAQAYAIEQDRRIARFCLRANQQMGFNGAIDVVCGDSRSVGLEQPVDVVVAELIGGLGNDEAMSPILEDARKRHLKPGGTLIPRRVDVHLCPVEAPEAHAQIPTVYDGDLIVPPEKALPPFRAYYEILGLPASSLLSSPALLDSINLMDHTEIAYERRFCFHMAREAVFSGFAAWFVADLAEGVTLDTSPWAPTTCWGQTFLPVRHELEVREADRIELTLSAVVPPGRDRPFYTWAGAITRGQRVIGSFAETNAPATP